MGVGTAWLIMGQHTLGGVDVAVRTSAGGPAWSMTWGGLEVHVLTLTRNVAETIWESIDDTAQERTTAL